MSNFKKGPSGNSEESLSKVILKLIRDIDNGWVSIIKQDNVVIQINTNVKIPVELNEPDEEAV